MLSDGTIMVSGTNGKRPQSYLVGQLSLVEMVRDSSAIWWEHSGL